MARQYSSVLRKTGTPRSRYSMACARVGLFSPLHMTVDGISWLDFLTKRLSKPLNSNEMKLCSRVIQVTDFSGVASLSIYVERLLGRLSEYG